MPEAHRVMISPAMRAQLPWSTTDEITEALRGNRPVVALESTVLTHGLPRAPRTMSAKFTSAHPSCVSHSGISHSGNSDRPTNLATATAVEAQVRAHGAIPATIAVIDGQIRVGLTNTQLEQLCSNRDASKISTRDLGSAIARKRTGGTTVASTTAIANLAGISVFATGGIGGVHRGWGQTLDISADLMALATNPTLVVCAGAKILLDLPATLEALETLGVPMIGFRTKYLPRFTVPADEAIPLADSVESAVEVARFIAAHWSIAPSCGALLVQACPAEFALPAAEIEGALAIALADAVALGIRGAATTPFLLERLATAVEGGMVIEANIALLMANAALAADVAVALSNP